MNIDSTPSASGSPEGGLQSRSTQVAQRYVLGELLGEGAMGKVYAAFDAQAGRSLALKVLKRGEGEADPILFRFKQEFQAARLLFHPHIVKVHDFGLDGDTAYFTMELVQGASLTTGARHSVSQVVEDLAQILLALDFVHARGMLHRDLKPENVRFSAEGVLKLLDMGLMEPIGTQHAGSFSGTLSYLPPEVFLGQPLSASADLYSVGVLAYELLTGTLPFGGGASHEVIAAHLNQTPPSLLAACPDLPADLADVLMRLLAKAPADRPQRASEVLRALKPYLSPELLAEADRQGYSYLLAPSLVGRHEEMSRLITAIREASGGQGGGLFLGSQPGIGKSRLIQEARLFCQLEDIDFLDAACSYEGGGAYGVIRQILHALYPITPEDLRPRYMRLMSDLTPQVRPQGPLLDKRMLHEGITSLIADIARRRPVVLCIDDLQWADTLSLEVLALCLYEHQRAPVLWLGTYRLDEVGPGHPVLHATQEGTATAIVLAPLGPEDIASLVRGMLGSRALPEGLLDLLSEATEGNCFFVIEMLRFLVDRGHLKLSEGEWRLALLPGDVGVPRSIEVLVCRRLEGLSAEARSLAQLSAVVAETLSPEVLRHLSGLGEHRMIDAIQELVERCVWRRHENGYHFVHDRIRESLYAELSPEEARRWHQQVAERLHELALPAATVGHHFARGNDRLTGVRLLRQAGQEAERMGAMQEAFRHWKQAADLLEAHPAWKQEDLLLTLWLDIGMKCGFSVDSRVGEELLEKALARLENLGHPFLAARAMGIALQLLKRLPQAIAKPILDRLSRPIPFKAPRFRGLPPNYLALVPLLIEANTWLTICCNTNGKIDKALQVNRKAQALVPDRASWGWGVVMTAYAYSRVLAGRFDESVTIARQAFELLESEQSPQAIDMSCAALILANNQVYQGEMIREDLRSELANRSSTYRMTEWEGMVQYAPMVHYALTGRAPEAWRAIAEAQPFSRRCGRGTVLEREIQLATARVHAVRGEFEAALSVIEHGIRLDAIVALPYFTSRFFEIRGRVHLEQGNLDAAEQAFQEVLLREGSHNLQFTTPEAHLGLSEVARRRGDRIAAEMYLASARAILETPEFRCAIKRIYLDRQTGRLAMSQRQWPEAIQHFRSAIALARTQDNPWQCALTLTDLGAAEQARGDERAALKAWHEAIALYEATDNADGARRVQQLIQAAAPASQPPRLNPQQEIDRLAVLQRFADAVAAHHEEGPVLEALLTHAMQAIDAQRGAILKLDETGLETVVSSVGNTIHWGWGPPVSHSLVRRAVASDEALLVADAQDDVELSTARSVVGQSLRTLICLPLDDGPTRVLYADRPTCLAGGFDQGHMWLMRALVQFGRSALHHARVVDEARSRTDRLAMLNRVSLMVSSCLNTDQILDHLLGQVLRLTGAELAMVTTGQDGHYEVLGVCEDGPGGALAFSRTVLDRVMAERKPLCIFDTEAAGRQATSQSMLDMGLRSIMAVPLEAHDHLLGALYVSSRVMVRTFSEDDLELLRAIAAHAALALQNARQVRLLEEKRAIEHELAIAKTIQQGLFPAHPASDRGLDVQGACQAAREVGGDFYDVVPLSDGRIAIALGDVSGKSVSAALYMAIVRTALRIAVDHAISPRECLKEVNRRIRDDLTDGSFVTCFLGVFDPATRRLAFASAGHHLGYRLHDGDVLPLSGQGLPLGLEPEVFDLAIEDRVVALAPGDQVVLFTDGVIEALNARQEEFGEEGLIRALVSAGPTAAGTLEEVLARIQDHVAEAPQFDDMTLLIARATVPDREPAPHTTGGGIPA